ncbi:MAG: ADP-ribosylglycohydrolase family protein [Rothia sp. (in: high G+C Gram-positive bacteria)]|uniref:ADP-ribosylglycohydrolase family protein n=1 Tax=Rothia sp. (in: high G+C Gram-positive bacteria) TaxID=1885016 RepID=UPI0026E07068|nr:ADP-ribosylglycohydrolase family protein [Rothia sp. (in: high G+C Gram-positive bacteria)]MDO5750177.1 ADP-ribosylglycohydrolase family protein [Rothia sp. (in: high G+C Gram-positive bacteria)]
MTECTSTPLASSPAFGPAVESALLGAAAGDAAGYPVELLPAAEITSENLPLSNASELIFSDDTQLLCYTLDALTEVLEWNNRGVAADELACLWLAYLRWVRGMGYELLENAPFSLDREIDSAESLHDRQGPGQATLEALLSGEMQSVSKNMNPDALGSGALVRAAALGFLPVATEQTVVLLAARSAALTHGHPEALASAVACALTVRELLAQVTGAASGSLRDAVTIARELCEHIASMDSIPGSATLSIEALDNALSDASAAELAERAGNDWRATTVLSLAIAFALEAEKSMDSMPAERVLVQALNSAASVDSDSDSTAALTGLFLCVRYPQLLESVPESVLTRLRGAEDIRAVAQRYLAQLV